MRIAASWIDARKLSSRLSYRVATALKCLSLLKKRSTALRCLQSHGLKDGMLTRLGMGLTQAPAPRAFSVAQGVAVIGAVAQENVACLNRIEHVDRRATVMGLSGCELQADRPALRIDEGVDFRGQPAARATHAIGSGVFFLPLAAC